MRSFITNIGTSIGTKVCSAQSLLRLALFAPALASLAAAGSASAQSAPYVIPYTMSSYAGGHPAYTAGAPCANGIGVALDTAGDGCLSSNVYVGADPHDLRVDGTGNVFYLDDTASAAVVHKINPYTTLQTIYVGNLLGIKACTVAIIPPLTKYGDGCQATDGVSNSTGGKSAILKNVRGLGIATNGDLFVAGYGDYYVHKIAASTLNMSVVAGTGLTGYSAGAPGVSQVDQVRGVTADANGNVLAVDTANNAVRLYTLSTNSIGLALNLVNNPPTTQTKNVVLSGVALNAAYLAGPEDAAYDSNGNLYIADSSNGVIRAVYNGSGSLPGIPTAALATGSIYTIAGYNNPAVPNPFVYPSNGTAAPVLATTVSLSAPRKISLDSRNNLYIADAGANVIWFVDNATGYIRLLAGSYGQTASVTPTYICTPAQGATDSIGDGCPAPQSAIFSTGANGTAMGVSPDTQGNVYLSDAQDLSTNSNSRVRKVLSGLNFPTYTGTPITQQVLLHFAAGDSPAATRPYTLKGTAADFTLGTATCTVNTTADNTDDCLLPITFAPSVPGYDTATLTITSTNGGVNSYLLTGLGTASAIAFDPGNTAFLSATSNVSAVSIVSGGTGYTTAPTVTFSSPASGTTATGTATIASGSVTGVTITNPGSGYTSAPTITFAAAPAGGSLATATSSISPTAAGTAIANSQAVILDSAGNAYIADTANNRVLFYNATTSALSVFAGTGTSGNSGNGGAATSATLNGPRALAIDTTGSVYIADTGNNVIRKVSASGIITLFAGGASAVCSIATDTIGDGCPALKTTLSAPSGLAADNLGNLYVADTGNNLIRLIAGNTNVSLFAGGAASVCSSNTDTIGDGCPAVATTFSAPTGLAFDINGKNLFVADTGNSDVRKIALTTTYATSGTTVSNIQINPVTLAAGSGQAGTTLAASGLGAGSALSKPTGIAVDAAANLYIADTGNSAIRLVTAGTGVISTLVGVTGTPGLGVIGGAATLTALSSPAAVAVSPLGTLFIADTGNNRILTDARSQVAFNFGRTNIGAASPLQNVTELNIGVSSATLPTPPTGTQSPTNTQFTLTPAANSTGSIPACASGTFTPGAICNLQGQFTPSALGSQTVTYTQSGTGAAGLTPSISLSGFGAVLTTTSSSVAQTTPVPPINSQFGASLVLTTTVTPSACNLAAPNCYATGAVTFLVDGVSTAPVNLVGSGTSTTTALPATASQTVTGLAVGVHKISCSYSGDAFYAASTCPSVNITVALASTTSLLSATGSNLPAFPTTSCSTNINTGVTTCQQSVLTANVLSNTIGVPNGGTVTFFASGIATPLGSSSLGGNPAQANLVLAYSYDKNGNLLNNNTLPAGSYTLTCAYSGAGNFGPSTCTGIPFVVLAQPVSITIPPDLAINGYNGGTKPCGASQLYTPGLFVPSLGNACPYGLFPAPGFVPTVAIAQGATTDATVFFIPSNTLTGTITFACSGLPAATTCTFSPTSVTVAAGTAFVTPQYVDVTFFNDLQPGNATGSLRTPHLGPNTRGQDLRGQDARGMALASILGWPIAAFGLFALLRLRRKDRGRQLTGISLLALLLVMVGSTLGITGCAGPGAYKAVLTPAGTYPITITITGGGATATTIVNYTVTTPGIPGQQ